MSQRKIGGGSVFVMSVSQRKGTRCSCPGKTGSSVFLQAKEFFINMPFWKWPREEAWTGRLVSGGEVSGQGVRVWAALSCWALQASARTTAGNSERWQRCLQQQHIHAKDLFLASTRGNNMWWSTYQRLLLCHLRGVGGLLQERCSRREEPLLLLSSNLSPCPFSFFFPRGHLLGKGRRSLTVLHTSASPTPWWAC